MLRRALLSGIAATLLTLPTGALAKPQVPAPPITILVTDPGQVARDRENDLLVTLAGMFVDVDAKVVDEIAAQMTPKLEARGVQAVVSRVDVTISAAAARPYWLWDATTQELTPAAVKDGTYKGIVITVMNPDDLVRAEKGKGTLVLGKLLQVNLGSRVSAECGAVILQELQAEKISALVSF